MTERLPFNCTSRLWCTGGDCIGRRDQRLSVLVQPVQYKKQLQLFTVLFKNKTITYQIDVYCINARFFQPFKSSWICWDPPMPSSLLMFVSFQSVDLMTTPTLFCFILLFINALWLCWVLAATHQPLTQGMEPSTCSNMIYHLTRG